MTEIILKVTPEQFETVRRALRREDVVYGVTSYAVAQDALRSIGIEPTDNVTYRFEVVSD